MIEFTLKKNLKKHTVKMYDNIEQMPIERFNKANKYWMLHDNIGSSIADFDTNHYNKLVLLAKDEKKLVAELNNFRILVFNIMNEINVEHLSFACLIYSIDGEVMDDLSENNLQDILTKLSGWGLTQETLKKKLMKSSPSSTKI